MDKIKTIEGDLVARDARFVIVASRFNEFIVESLIKSAIACLKRHGAVLATQQHGGATPQLGKRAVDRDRRRRIAEHVAYLIDGPALHAVVLL